MALIQMEFMSNSIQHYTSMNVLLPVDQWDRTEIGPFPTLYLLHGWGGNYSDWVCNSRIAVWAQRRGIAVVMPSGDNSFYLNYPEREEYYEKFIGEELIALTRKAFPLSDKREDTWIAGLSMGGGGAIRCGLRYGHVFSKAAGLSALGTEIQGMLQPFRQTLALKGPGVFFLHLKCILIDITAYCLVYLFSCHFSQLFLGVYVYRSAHHSAPSEGICPAGGGKVCPLQPVRHKGRAACLGKLAGGGQHVAGTPVI